MANLNCQGLSRRDSSLMSCLVATPGYTIISSDISSGEPTCTTHYSGDLNYRLATFDMIGQKPYFREDGLLIIDDIYLMVASRYPAWEQEIKDAYYNTYEGVSFVDKWLENPEYVSKGILGHIRGKAKSLCLGIGYSMGPERLVLTALENGFTLILPAAKTFYKQYWTTFPRVKALANKLEALYKKQGFIQNDFGYCLYPSDSYKCLNYLIQSSVTGLMHLFKKIFFEKCPWAEFITVIHDEILFEVPDELLAETRRLFDESVIELNKILNWSVNMRFGWVEGKTWFEAK